MISRTLARRLEQLEAFVLPTDTPQLYIRIHLVNSDGEVVATHVIDMGQARPTKVLPGRLRPAQSRYR
jgi:hypothetical protein